MSHIQKYIKKRKFNIGGPVQLDPIYQGSIGYGQDMSLAPQSAPPPGYGSTPTAPKFGWQNIQAAWQQMGQGQKGGLGGNILGQVLGSGVAGGTGSKIAQAFGGGQGMGNIFGSIMGKGGGEGVGGMLKGIAGGGGGGGGFDPLVWLVVH